MWRPSPSRKALARASGERGDDQREDRDRAAHFALRPEERRSRDAEIDALTGGDDQAAVVARRDALAEQRAAERTLVLRQRRVVAVSQGEHVPGGEAHRFIADAEDAPTS